MNTSLSWLWLLGARCLLTLSGCSGSILATESEREEFVVEFEPVVLVVRDFNGALVRGFETPMRVDREPTVVRFTDWVVDVGDGFVLCLGGLGLSSPPPGCTGIGLDGLEDSGWARTESSVRWGERPVAVTWPPVNGTVRVLDDAAPLLPLIPPSVIPLADLPDNCDPGQTAANARLLSLADEHPEMTAFGWKAQGVLVVPVKSSRLGEFRSLLGEHAETACLVEVPWSRRDVEMARDRLETSGVGKGPLVSISGANRSNRLLIEVAVFDRELVDRILAELEDPAIAVVTARGAILK